MDLQQINWIAYADDMVLNTDTDYVFKINVEKYYNLVEEEYLNLLSADELVKANRFIQLADKQRFVTGRHFLRHIIARKFDKFNAEILFKYTEFNKPYLDGIEFNIAHSGNYVLVAISNSLIGADIEFMNNSFDHTDIMYEIFNTNEVAYINNAQTEALNFYTLWTRKEALLKATGEGLTDDLKIIDCLGDVVERSQAQYTLISFRINDDYMAALASTANNNLLFFKL